jgi:signal recognition particle receptor subunit beta
VADSSRDRYDANLEALRDLTENLDFYGFGINNFPYVLQLNKRDEMDTVPVPMMVRELSLRGEPVVRAIAVENRGVRETLSQVARQLLLQLKSELTPDLA